MRLLWHMCDTVQYRKQLEEQSDDEQEETVDRQRKCSIGWRLMLRPNRSSTECGTQPEERADIPGSLLHIIVKRIFGALLERSQGGCPLHHFPYTQDDHPDEVEQQSNHGEKLHAPPLSRCVSSTAGFPSDVDDEKTIQTRGGQTATATPKDGRLVQSALRAYVARVCVYTALASLPAGAAELTTRFTRFGLIDREGTAFEFFAVEPLDSGFGRLALRHLDKPEAFGAPGVTVGNDIDLVHSTILLKELAEVMIRCTKRKVTYKDIHVQSSSS